MSELDHEGSGEVGTCHVCGAVFETQLELSEHLMKDHPEDLLPDQPTT
jgi:hypothetical protein